MYNHASLRGGLTLYAAVVELVDTLDSKSSSAMSDGSSPSSGTIRDYPGTSGNPGRGSDGPTMASMSVSFTPVGRRRSESCETLVPSFTSKRRTTVRVSSDLICKPAVQGSVGTVSDRTQSRVRARVYAQACAHVCRRGRGFAWAWV